MTLSNRIALKPMASEVARLNDWLDDVFARSGTNAHIAADLKLCINEVVANLISYAFDSTTDPAITIDIELEPALARAVVVDNGGYFDLRQWPALERPKDLMSAKAGGYGIALIRERANRIDYTRVGAINRLEIECLGISP